MPNYRQSIIAGLGRPALLPGMPRRTQIRGSNPSAFGSGSTTSPGTFYRSPDLDVEGFNQGMQSELRDRIFQNSRLSGYGSPEDQSAVGGEVEALKGLLGSYQAEAADSPIGRQRQQLRSVEEANVGARAAGYPDIQTARQMQEEMERYKLDQPTRQEQARGQSYRSQAEAQAAGDVEVQRLRGQQEADKVRSYQQLLSALSGNKDISRIGLPGGLSATFRAEEDEGVAGVPVSLLRDITSARDRVANARNETERAAAQQTLRQAQLMGVGNAPVSSPDLQEWMAGVLQDPANDALSTDQILDEWFELHPEDLDVVTPEEQDEVRRILSVLRGQ